MKEENKENSFKILDTLFKLLSKQQISDWVQLGQVGLVHCQKFKEYLKKFQRSSPPMLDIKPNPMGLGEWDIMEWRRHV